MANRNFPQARQWTYNMMPVAIRGSVAIGSTGAVGTLNAKGINAIVRLAAGVYRIQLQDNFAALLGCQVMCQSPVTGSAVAGGSFVATTVYQIVTLGTTTQAQWVTAGVPSGITAAVGVVFKAAGIGAGSGTVKALGASGITSIELLGGLNANMISNQPYADLSGGFVIIQCLGPTSSSDTTPVATDPASGSQLVINLIMNNSQVQ